jgi:hypothetical protein
MRQIYREAGYETTTGELPDYLPLILEFLSECPASDRTETLWSYLGAVEKPAGALRNAGNPYSLLLDVVRDLAAEFSVQCSEVRVRKSEDGRQRTEDRWEKEDRPPMAGKLRSEEGRWAKDQRSEIGGRMSEAIRKRKREHAEDGEQTTDEGRQKTDILSSDIRPPTSDFYSPIRQSTIIKS